MVRTGRAQDTLVGWTPLIVAAHDGQADLVESLLRTPGIDVDETTDVGDRALVLACRRGHLDVVKLLVAAGSRVEAQAGEKFGPLVTAALRGRLEVVKYLVEEAGADVARTGLDGCTPIRCAAREGHADIVEYLRQVASGREHEVCLPQMFSIMIIII
jgi:ankyrin repeat protein